MATIKKTNIYNYLKSKFTNTASDIKMNGTQAAGSSDLIARADHVHPVDTSRAASSHTHGGISNDGKVGTTANKPLITGTGGAVSAGNFEATATNIKMNGSQSVGSLNTFARGDHVHPVDTSRAPVSHASSGTDYGVGSASNYGHVKVDSAPTSSSANAVASGGVKTALDTKQNEVETQAKITSFTNKDRINIDRIWDYINNADANYYKLDLMCVVSNNVYYHDKVPAVTNSGVLIGCTIYKGKNSPSPQGNITYTVKYLDGTVIYSDTSEAREIPHAWKPVSTPSTPGIYYVYAEATIDGSVVRSNILSLFVKDNNNLLDYNTWSCGEYNNNPEIFNVAPNTIRTVSTEYSNIGESSIRLTKTADSGAYSRITHTENLSNKTVIASAHIRSATQKSVLIIIEFNGSSVIQQASVDVPANTSKKVNVSLNTGNSCSAVGVQFNNNDGNGSIIFVDDISLVAS
ncbi:MAG: hypothetical protein K6A34_06040 [Methanobrevibacter sp.]|nr:hypothetical protein [Methanobrevibacter sp.]